MMWKQHIVNGIVIHRKANNLLTTICRIWLNTTKSIGIVVFMNISTKGRYGTKLILDLAANSGQGPVLIKEISKRLKLSQKYLGQLALTLKNAGLLISLRGAKGGYLLSRPAGEINLYDIVECLEGPICLSDKNDDCAANIIWDEIAEGMKDRMRAVTLAELAEIQKEMSQKFAYII